MSSTVCSVVIPSFYKQALLWPSVAFFLAGVYGANGMVGLLNDLMSILCREREIETHLVNNM